jgi:hypothetical protein
LPLQQYTGRKSLQGVHRPQFSVALGSHDFSSFVLPRTII